MTATVTIVRCKHEPMDYVELPGEREALVRMCGGEEAYRLWCWDIMHGQGNAPRLKELLP